MTDLCQLLEWDSRFFGRRIARVEKNHLDHHQLEEVLLWCKEKGIECLYFLCSPNDDESVTLAESAGFHLVDVRVELNWKTQSVELSSNAIRPYEEKDLPELQQIASQVYTDTRFHFDKKFDADKASELYQEWITKSCQSQTVRVFVVAAESGVAGFVTCEFDNAVTKQIGRIGLLGIKSEAQGKAYGRQLVRAAQDYFHSSGTVEVRVVTQGRNIAAQRLYQACDFRSYKLGLWYHKWF